MWFSIKKVFNFNSGRPPRRLCSIRFKEAETSGIFSFCRRQYNFEALGDVWMVAKRNKDNRYNLYIYSDFISVSQKMIAAFQPIENVKTIMEDFETRLSRQSDYNGPGILQYKQENQKHHFSRSHRSSYGN